MSIAAWYFTLFVTLGGGLGGNHDAIRSKSDAFFFATKAECTRVLDRITEEHGGDTFHYLLQHDDYKVVHRHSWNRECRPVPNGA